MTLEEIKYRIKEIKARKEEIIERKAQLNRKIKTLELIYMCFVFAAGFINGLVVMYLMK